MEGPARLTDPDRRPTSFHQVLIILFGAMFLGGGSDGLEERVESEVKDDARRAIAVDVARGIEESLRAGLEAAVQWHEEFYALVSLDETTEEDVRTSVRAFIETLEAAEREHVDRRFELRAALSEDEWNAVFDRD